MGKAEENKRYKQGRILDAAYELFTQKGFLETTISDISQHAGTAKGTFYLYFNDKYDLRDRLVARKAGQLFKDATRKLVEERENLHLETFEEQLIYVIDEVINALCNNLLLLKFITRNLSWGIFRHAAESQNSEINEQYRFFIQAIEESSLQCLQPELMLFTIIELISGTCYSCILHQQPVSMEEYLPWLHKCIHGIIQSYTVGTA